jgi:hypothetical protein
MTKIWDAGGRGEHPGETTSLFKVMVRTTTPCTRGVAETPFQPATQTVLFRWKCHIQAPNCKRHHKKNPKICAKHGHLLDEGDICHCSSSGGCGANLLMHHTIGDEFTWAKSSAVSLASRYARLPLTLKALLVERHNPSTRVGFWKKNQFIILAHSIWERQLEQIMPGRTKTKRIICSRCSRQMYGRDQSSPRCTFGRCRQTRKQALLC